MGGRGPDLLGGGRNGGLFRVCAHGLDGCTPAGRAWHGRCVRVGDHAPAKPKIARSDKCGDCAGLWRPATPLCSILPPSARYHPAQAAIELAQAAPIQPVLDHTHRGCAPQPSPHPRPRPRTRLHGYDTAFTVRGFPALVLQVIFPLRPLVILRPPRSLCSAALTLWNDRVRLAHFEHPIAHPIPHTDSIPHSARTSLTSPRLRSSPSSASRCASTSLIPIPTGLFSVAAPTVLHVLR